MQNELLQARDARQAAIDRACASRRPAQGVVSASSRAGGSVLFASTGVPGADKAPPGLQGLFAEGCRGVRSRLPAALLDTRTDALGPWTLFRVALSADDAKRVAVAIESDVAGGRLLDLDVYGDDGRQVDRAAVGVPARSCLVCERPAVECIRLRRHEAIQLGRAVARLLAPYHAVRVRRAPGGSDPRAASAKQTAGLGSPAERLAVCLVDGARAELELTPKPGLVDRHDNGSHPDLSFEAMSASIDLLPAYFDDLLRAAAAPSPQSRTTSGPLAPEALAACIEAGRRAEQRMAAQIETNAHRGYIFLGGLALLASLDAAAGFRGEIRRLSHLLFGRSPGIDAPSNGALVRARHHMGGIHREALDGLPAVFDHGLPALDAYRRGHGTVDRESQLHYLMSVLMQVVEDTTAVHRCGPAGLQRLRDDGQRLQRLIDERHDYLPWLSDLNDAYRRLNLTMVGVADCLALTVAIDRWLR